MDRYHTWRGIAVLSITAISACRSADIPPDTGIIPAPTAQISLEEDLRLGTDDPLFASVGDMKADADGRIYVADVRDPSNIYKFTPDGELIGTVGGHGEGPGEYRYPSPVMPGPDSLVVWDSYSDHFVVYEPDGTFRRSSERFTTDNPTSLNMIGQFGGGYFVSETPYFTPGIQEEDVGEVMYRIINGEGALGDVFWSSGMSEFLIHSTSNSIMVSSQPFGRRTACTSARDRLYCVWTEAVEIHGFTADGDTLPPLRVTYDPLPISASARQEALDGVRDEFRDTVTLPDTHPALSNVTGDDRGRLWLRMRITEDDEVTDYWIVDPSDRSVVSTRVDGNMSLTSVEGGFAYGRLTTPEGEILAVRYRIGEGPPA